MIHYDPNFGTVKNKHVVLSFSPKEHKDLRWIANRHGTSPEGILYIALSEWIMRNDGAKKDGVKNESCAL